MRGIQSLEVMNRVVIENVQPVVNNGSFSVKRVVGESLTVSADIFCDGHDILDAAVIYKRDTDPIWQSAPMYQAENDRWRGIFLPVSAADYSYCVRAWVDRFLTWQNNFLKKITAHQDIAVDRTDGASLIRTISLRTPIEITRLLNDVADELEQSKDRLKCLSIATDKEIAAVIRSYPDLSRAVTSKEYPLTVNNKQALFSTWYEFFPRSMRTAQQRGTLKDAELLLPAIAAMGFDVVYLPPIHPIGIANRKGKNNSTKAENEDPGSPWAIGSLNGGHKSVDPDLGTIENLEDFIVTAHAHGIAVALDLAFQCSPDHPYCKDHPEWFKYRADGTIQYAENPPKKYEDIVPFDFESNDWIALREELLTIVLFWINKGITIFRVDNPHTKPLPFWEWLIVQVRKQRGDILFLAEAFTRPKVMYHLAKAGFSQSYTYFTWRNTKRELQDYMYELTKTDVVEFFRPNFWPNTPDILPDYLQFGGERAFAVRLILAGTLCSNYGIYGPVFEHAISNAVPGKEEYLNSEKYEIKNWKSTPIENLVQLITALNMIRKDNKALHTTKNITFCECSNEQILVYLKNTDDLKSCIIVVVNLDPFHEQKTKVHIPLDELHIASNQAYLLEDLLSGERFFCLGADVDLCLGVGGYPAFIFYVQRRMSTEHQFSYY